MITAAFVALCSWTSAHHGEEDYLLILLPFAVAADAYMIAHWL